MFCKNCGAKLNDDSRFCGKCGTKVSIDTTNNPYTNYNPSNNISSQNYTTYEVFDSSDKLSSKIYKLADKLLAKMDAKTVNVSNFIITDRSIIFNNNEYLFEEITVLSPYGTFVTNLSGDYIGHIYTNINGIQYHFNCSKDKQLKLFFEAIKANDKIELNSRRQMLQYILMLCCFIFKADFKIRTLPVIYEEENKFDEFLAFNKRVKIKPNETISDEDRKLINDYTYIQEKLNDYYKTTNAIPNAGHNRHFGVLAEIINYMTDSDTDTEEAIKKYNQKLLEDQLYEEQRRQEELERQQNGYYDQPKGGGLISGVLKTAAGVAIGNKISGAGQKSNTKKELQWHYTCSFTCPYRGKDYGPTKCRKNPATCGYGIRY